MTGHLPISVFFGIDEAIIGTVFELPFFDGEPPFLLNLLQHGVPIFRIRPLRSGCSLKESFVPVKTKDIKEQEEWVARFLKSSHSHNPPKHILFNSHNSRSIFRPNPT